MAKSDAYEQALTERPNSSAIMASPISNNNGESKSEELEEEQHKADLPGDMIGEVPAHVFLKSR